MDILDALFAWAGRRKPKQKPAREDSYDVDSTRLIEPPKKRKPDPLYGPQVPPAPVVKARQLPKQPKTTRRERKQKFLDACKSMYG
jgi:hypothetical protein